MKQYRYIIGPDPYKFHSENNTEGNGSWETTAESLNEALEIIFGTMTFPAEAVGRWEKTFIPDVSLSGLGASEVIQVWSDKPEAISKTKVVVDRVDYIPHAGDGKNLGVLVEIPVYEIQKWLRPEKKMLGHSTAKGESQTQISEIGATVTQFLSSRTDLQMAVQDKRMDLMAAKWQMQAQEEVLDAQVKTLESKLFLAETYRHGARGIVHLMRGERGTGPYAVFQERQFLNKEISLLANLTDFGFEQFKDLDKWLVSSGKMFKFLPYERTILVTRIRDKSKDYGCPWLNALENQFNFTSVIWVRDGQNVWRMPTDLDFQNAVFPDVNEEKRLTDYVAEFVYNECFNPVHKWSSAFTDAESKDKPGALRAKASESREPYLARWHGPRSHGTLECWKASIDYTTKIQVEIAQAAGRYLIEHNMERMTFLLLLQGMVDNTNLLDIPKGTNLFDWKASGAFFNLVQDYSHGLPDGHTRDLMAAACRIDQVRTGDVLLVDTSKWNTAKFGRDSLTWRLGEWRFYRVFNRKEGCPLVVHHYPRRHYPHEPVKTPTILRLTEDVRFIRLALPKSIVERALDDREWKSQNLRIVPILAQWDFVMKQAENVANFTMLRLKNPDESLYDA